MKYFFHILLVTLCIALPGKGQTEKTGSPLPTSFRPGSPNRIERSELLTPFYTALAENTRPVRILHWGDSHVRGHIFTTATRHTLEEAWGKEAVEDRPISYRTTALATETGRPGLVYHAYGINGATSSAFLTPELLEMADTLHPDLIILSFGTNESHGTGYDEASHRAEMEQLLDSLTTRCPQAIVLLTTPPGEYLKRRIRRKGRRRTVRTANPRTLRAATVIAQTAADRNLPLWDLYHIAGGEYACRNWSAGRYFRADGIHFTPAGYTLQGNLLAHALLDAATCRESFSQMPVSAESSSYVEH